MAVPHFSTENLDQVIAIAREAGDAIIAHRNASGYTTEVKSDNSPVTAADREAHRIISLGLQALMPEIPVFSEEGSEISWQERRSWQCYWLVDPLDGTREFILGSGEFTVNIALIDRGSPVLGVVLQPATGMLYCGCKTGTDPDSWMAFRENAAGDRDRLIRRQGPRPGDPLTVAVSRHYGENELRPFLHTLRQRHGEVTVIKAGSATKFCLLAEGKADLYIRLAPTCEWDTAAGQALVEAAGGGVFDFSGTPLGYNSRADVLNPPFYGVADCGQHWQTLFDLYPGD